MSDRDRRVLDVPPGPARSPGTVPGGLPRLLGPPEDEVRRMSLALLDFDAGTRAELLDFLTAELAPSGEGRRVEIDALVLRDVGVSLLDETLNLLHDLVHIVRCEGVQVDGRAVQPLHHVPEFREILRDDLVPRPPGRLHLRDESVLDVRRVLQIVDVEALGPDAVGSWWASFSFRARPVVVRSGPASCVAVPCCSA